MIKLHSITNIYDLIDNLTDRHHRITISFSELKNSWNAFDLDVVETDLSKKLVAEPVNSFERSFTEIYTIYNYYKTDKKNPRVNFHCYSETGNYLYDYPITWFVFGPREVVNQANFRFREELERATVEQRQQMIIDGFMTSLDAKYFWCARLILWIEENCQNFKGDIEDIAVEFIYFFYTKEDAHDWVGDNCGYLIFIAIQLLCNAINLTLSDDEIKTLRELLYDHFDSHVIASQDSIENYMAATEWMSIKHRLDVEPTLVSCNPITSGA